jgi:hypothetical protein
MPGKTSSNGRRARGVEKHHGWPRGKSSEGRYKTPGAEVARNRATRSRRAQTAERVRNPESGWRRRGKPTQCNDRLGSKRRRGPNPKGGVVQLPTPRVLHLCAPSIRSLRWPDSNEARRWEAAFGTTARQSRCFGGASREHEPESTPADELDLGRPHPRGIFVAGVPISVGPTASRTHRTPGLGLGCGEAPGDVESPRLRRHRRLRASPEEAFGRRPGRHNVTSGGSLANRRKPSRQIGRKLRFPADDRGQRHQEQPGSAVQRARPRGKPRATEARPRTFGRGAQQPGAQSDTQSCSKTLPRIVIEQIGCSGRGD